MKTNEEIKLSGDKSISHRALMLASISRGTTRISNLCNGNDVKSTIDCLRNCGVEIYQDGKDYIVKSSTLLNPNKSLNCGNSGTTIRLLSGLLSGQGITADLYGDKSLMSRPMDRIITPLKKMGANISFKNDKIILKKSKINSISINNELPSAQVKSCIILASLGGSGQVNLNESYNTRDHTERMVQLLSKDSLFSDNQNITIKKSVLQSQNMIIPGDISKASFIIAYACLKPDSDIIFKDILVNSSRMGFVNCLKKMGANIQLDNKKIRHNEPVADIRVQYNGQLKNINISDSDIPGMIDEVPILSVVGAFSNGVMQINGLKELRFKESNRVLSILHNLKSMGSNVLYKQNALLIKGKKYLYNTKIKTFSDHRIAMAFYIASLFSKGRAVFDDIDCIDISFPDFFDKIKEVSS